MLDPTGHLDRSPKRLRLTLALLISLAVHAVLLEVGVPELMVDLDTQRLLELECPMECEEEEPEQVAYELRILPPDIEPEEAIALPEPEPEPEPELEEPEPEEELEPLPQNHYMVDLQTDEEDTPPDDTQYLAPVNMRTDREVQAEETRMEAAAPAPSREEELPEVEPGEPEEAEEIETTTEERVAVVEPPDESTSEETQDNEAARVESTPQADPNVPRTHDGPRLDLSAFNPTLQTYQRSPMSTDDRQDRQRIARQMRYEGYLHTDDQAEWDRMRATLENMVPEVRTGTETRLNARRHAYAAYISYVHRRIHELWANDYLMSLDLRFDPSDPMSNPNLQTTLEIVIADDGEIARVNIVRTSGQTMYDGEAISIVNRIGPLRAPPPAILSDNGHAYLHWNFWRDQRQCGTFGVSVHRVE